MSKTNQTTPNINECGARIRERYREIKNERFKKSIILIKVDKIEKGIQYKLNRSQSNKSSKLHAKPSLNKQ